MKRDVRNINFRHEKVLKKRQVKYKKVFILCASLLIIGIPVAFFINSKFKDEAYKLQAKAEVVDGIVGEETEVPEKEENVAEEVVVEEPVIENGGYFSLEDDSNADDAVIVSQNTNDLLVGNKIYPVRTDGRKVAYLTFDDGPSTTNTPEVLNILDEYEIKATFFVLGSSIDESNESQEVLKRIAKSGHAIGNHTYGHNYHHLYPGKVISVENFINDIEKNNEAMRRVLGKDFSTRVIRFPGGYWSWQGRMPMREAMTEKGYQNIDWNALNGDAEGHPRNALELIQRAKDTVDALGPNADSVVLLMHDTYGKEETVTALPEIIEYLRAKGFEFRTIK